MNEPRPAVDDHDDVPDHVLDELRAAFGEATPGTGPEHAPDARVGTNDASPDDASPDDAAITVPLGSADAMAPTVPMTGPTTELETEPETEPETDQSTDTWMVDVPGDGAAPGGTSDDGAAPRSTIVIGGDDLPDAIYLDEATGASTTAGASRDTIVIGDDLDSSGAFDAVEVPSRSIDPRLRERRIAVKRAQGRRRLLWVSAISAALVVVVAVVAVFASSLFAVEVVDVQGAPYTTDRNGEQLQAVIDAMMGDPVLLVDTLAAQEALEQIPWVERALVYTDFPNRVVIDIRERRPFATYQGSDQRYRVIDRDGRVLDVLDGRPVDYMIISGPGPDLEPGSMAGTRFAEASQMIGALPAELRVMTESVSVDATTGELGLVLAGPTGSIEVRIGTFAGLDAKLARLLQQVRDGLDDVERIDVSSDDMVITRTPQV